jgi:hypothetical protein
MSLESGAGCDQSKQVPAISVMGPDTATSTASIGVWLEPRHREFLANCLDSERAYSIQFTRGSLEFKATCIKSR